MSRFLTALFASSFVSYTSLVSAASVIPPSHFAPSQLTSSRPDISAQADTENYIVFVKRSISSVDSVLQRVSLSPNHPDVLRTFNNDAFSGFVARLSPSLLPQLSSMPEISVLEPSTKVMSHTIVSHTPWGLERISNPNPVRGDPQSLNFNYYIDDDNPPGKNVDIYILDTGLNTKHFSFRDRARIGFSYNDVFTDGDGHGTHVAGTAAASYFGVASGANIIGVRVLNDNGTGYTIDSIRGIDWVVKNHNQRRTQPDFVGSIMSLSWGLSKKNMAIDSAIRGAVANGIHVSVAAGNLGGNSCDYSPASSGGAEGPAITVGSLAFNDTISAFSNTGRCIDIYAPGENIISSWIGAPKLVNILNGTSMACPHVTGIMAYYMAKYPQLAQNPAMMKRFLAETSQQSKNTDGKGTVPVVYNFARGPASETALRAAASLPKIKAIVPPSRLTPSSAPLRPNEANKLPPPHDLPIQAFNSPVSAFDSENDSASHSDGYDIFVTHDSPSNAEDFALPRPKQNMFMGVNAGQFDPNRANMVNLDSKNFKPYVAPVFSMNSDTGNRHVEAYDPFLGERVAFEIAPSAGQSLRY